MTPGGRWLIALVCSFLIHGMLLLGFRLPTREWFERSPSTSDPHLIVIQELMTQTDRPSDDNYVWSSEDHFEPQQKLPKYIQSRPRSKQDPQPGSGRSSSLKNWFDVPATEQSHVLGDDAELLLNARRYKHYSFFKRVYDKLYPLWISELQNRQDLWRGHTEGYYLTRVRIRMDGIGYLTHQEVLLSSSVTWIDAAAVDALERAQPYPNPSDDFLISDGASASKTYEFIYEFLFELQSVGFRYHLYRTTP